MKARQKYMTDHYGVVTLVRQASGGWIVKDARGIEFYVAEPRLKERVIKRRKKKATDEQLPPIDMEEK